MKPYPRYKDSGVEWIGEVPEGWEVIKIKYLIKDHSGNGFPHDEQGNRTEEIPFLKVSDLNGDGKYIVNSNNYVSKHIAEKYKWNLVPASSIVTAKIGESLRKNHRKLILKECIIDNNCIGIEAEQIDKDFSFYLHSIIDFDWFVNPGAVPSLSVEKYKAHFCAIPSLSEQTAIATFLDRKTAEIDKLIANKERLIELYEEEKKAVINQAVTKGLDPDAEMKDSGVEWLGEIPAHWEVKRLRYIGDCQNGVSKSGDYFGAGFPFISYGDVYNQFVLPEQPEGLANSTEPDQKNYSVVKGDVLFTRTSETIEEIGIASTCLKTIDQAVFSGFLIRFRPIDGILLEGFSKYYFRANIHRLFFVKEMNLVTRASLSQELLKRLPVLIPPIQVQEKIASYLDQQETILNSIISKLKTQIDLFKEYRTALISEAVTGKIDVRDAG